MNNLSMKIDTTSQESEVEKDTEDVEKNNKAIKAEEKIPKSPRTPDITFAVGDYCLVKRPADNNWRKVTLFEYLLKEIYLVSF